VVLRRRQHIIIHSHISLFEDIALQRVCPERSFPASGLAIGKRELCVLVGVVLRFAL